MASQTEIVRRGLIRLGVIPADRSATASQDSQGDATLEAMHAYWLSQGYVTWDLSSIPQEIEDPLVTLLALAMADDFGVTTEKLQRLSSKKKLAEQMIFAYDEIPNNETSSAEYY